jgi:phospholipid transport system transporter-binding protein
MAFRVAGPVTMANASATLAACTAAIDGGETVFSLDALAHSDSSCVAMLIAARRHAELAGRTLTLQAAPESVRSLASLYGVEGFVAG